MHLSTLDSSLSKWFKFYAIHSFNFYLHSSLPILFTNKGDVKVLVHFRATGDVKRMKQNKFKLNGAKQFSFILSWLRTQLQLKPNETLFVYCASAFAPSPDSSLYDLFQCFSIDGELLLNYCTTDAWG